MNATNLDSLKSYSIQVSTSNSNLGFDGGCTDQQEDATVSAGDTSHTSTLTLRACTTGGGIVTATLLHDGASVDTDTHSLTVTTAAASAYSAYSDDKDFRTRQHHGPGHGRRIYGRSV